MMINLLLTFAPIILKLTSWIFDKIDADKETKENFIKTVASFEKFRTSSAEIMKSEQQQFDEIKKIKENKKNGA